MDNEEKKDPWYMWLVSLIAILLTISFTVAFIWREIELWKIVLAR